MSSPNTETIVDEFVPYLPAEAKEGKETISSPPVTSKAEVPKFEGEQKVDDSESQFLANAEFWKSLLGDAWVSREIEKVISERLQVHIQDSLKRIEQEDKPKILQDAWAKGEKEGFEKGLQQGMEKAAQELEAQKAQYLLEQETWIKNQSALLDRLNAIGLEILSEKKAVLRDHEKMWSQSLRDLLEKFQVKEASGKAHAMEIWVAERIKEFGERKKVNISLSADEFKTLNQEISLITDFPYELSVGEDLQPGQIRVDCGDGGIFFSRPDSLKKIDEWLNRFFGNEAQKLES